MQRASSLRFILSLCPMVAFGMIGSAVAGDVTDQNGPAVRPTVVAGMINAAMDAKAPTPRGAESIDIDALTASSDFTIFMKPGVPDAVRMRALHKLWTVDASFKEEAPPHSEW